MIIRNAEIKDSFSISKICKNDLIQLTNKDEIFKNYEIYKSCMYMPTEEKFCNLIEKYLNEKSIKIFCCKDENKTNGMIVVSFIEDNKIEVLGIAVDTLHQHKGIGSFMINNLIEKFNLKYIIDYDSIQTIKIYASDSDSAKMILKYNMREQNFKLIQILSCEEI